MGILVHPKPDSYCIEWVAVQFHSEDGVLPVKVLLKGTRWVIQEAVISNAESFIVVSNGSDAWRINEGDWVVRSPHDKMLYMSHGEFQSQFNWRSE